MESKIIKIKIIMNLRILFFLTGLSCFRFQSLQKESLYARCGSPNCPTHQWHTPLHRRSAKLASAALSSLCPSPPRTPPPNPLLRQFRIILLLCICHRFFLCLGRGRSLCARTISSIHPIAKRILAPANLSGPSALVLELFYALM
jgi:hypothetical protein